MKAIQIKYCGPTNTLGSRWKVRIDSHKPKYYNRDYDLDGRDDALRVANTFLRDHLGWDYLVITAMGTIPNGDYVALIGKVGA